MAGEALPQAEEKEAGHAKYDASYENIQSGVRNVIHIFHLLRPFRRGVSLYAICQGGGGKMTPVNTLPNQANRGGRHAVFPGQICPAYRVTQGANASYIRSREFCRWRFFAPKAWLAPAIRFAQSLAHGVLHVLGRRNLFQIDKAIVGLDTVDVIGLFPWCEGASEGFQDEAVNKMVARPSVPATRVKAEEEIPTSGFTGPKVSIDSDRMLGETNYSPDMAQVGDLIATFMPDNGAPFFGGCARLRVHRKTPFGATPGAVNPVPRHFYPFHYNTLGSNA